MGAPLQCCSSLGTGRNDEIAFAFLPRSLFVPFPLSPPSFQQIPVCIRMNCSVVHDASVCAKCLPLPPASTWLNGFPSTSSSPSRWHDAITLVGWLAACRGGPPSRLQSQARVPPPQGPMPTGRSTKIAGLSSGTLNWPALVSLPNFCQRSLVSPAPQLPSLRAQATRPPTPSQAGKEFSLAEFCM